MKQEVMAGIVLIAIGFMLFGYPEKVWESFESWKNNKKVEPSSTYLKVVKMVGAVFIVAGFALSIYIIK